MLVFLLGCSMGTISWPTGSDDLETAYFLPLPASDTPEMLVVLANSYVGSCKNPDLRGKPEQAWEEVYLAVTRENARLAVLRMNRYGVNTWQGTYPIAEDNFQPNDLSGQDPFIFQGTYLGVEESEAEYEEGLVRGYVPTVFTFVPVVEAPGEVLISEWEPGVLLAGRLSFESLDVSATFRAVPCDVSYNNSIFPALETLSQVESF